MYQGETLGVLPALTQLTVCAAWQHPVHRSDTLGGSPFESVVLALQKKMAAKTTLLLLVDTAVDVKLDTA